MTDREPLTVGDLAGYRVEELIGRGGMGEVYRALDVRLGRPVALKVVRADLASDERFRERLLRESRLAASLDHPNVVPIYEVGDRDGRLFIAMRFVPGTDLRAPLRRDGPLARGRAVAIAAQLADALDAAHRRGLVHRDVKPSNVLLDAADEREHCYLADFGLTQSATERAPADGRLLGTVDYVAPEQIRGEAVDGRADQYALACVVFECLTGTVPFGRRSDLAALFAHLEEPVPPASERGAGLPAALDRVLARGMAKAPADRFESCSALVAAAGDALALAPPPARRRRPAALIAAAAAAVVAVAVAVLLLARGPAPPPPPGALVRLDPATNRVVARTPIAGHPGNVVVTPGGVWMADYRAGALWRYEPAADRLERITSTGEPRDVDAVGEKVFVAGDVSSISGVVSRYDARTGVREDGIDLLACALAARGGLLWVAGCPSVQRLTTGTGRLRVLRDVFLPWGTPPTVEHIRTQLRELAIGAGSLWVLGDTLDQRLWRLDARTGRIQATLALGFPPTSVAVAGGAVWITDAVHDRVVPIDVATHARLAPVRVGRGPTGIAAGAGALWVVNTLAGTLTRLDPRARRITTTIALRDLPRGVAVGAGSIWVTEHAP